MLSRRQFLTGTGAAALIVGTGLDNLVLGANSSEASPTRISFQEARANINLRQNYIEQIVKEEFGDEASNFIDKLVYDHNRRGARTYEAQNRLEGAEERIVDMLVQKLLPKYLNDPRTKGMSKSSLKRELRVLVRKEFRTMPGYDLLREKAIADSEKAEFEIGKMVTLPKSYDKRSKSGIFIFPESFEDADAIFKKYPATEEGLRSALRHEYRHARQNIEGVNLNGVKLSREYILKLNRKVFGFAKETEAYIQEADNTLKLGSSHPAYKESVAVFAQYLHRNLADPSTFIDPREYNAEERTVIGHAKSAIRNAARRHQAIAEELRYEINVK